MAETREEKPKNMFQIMGTAINKQFMPTDEEIAKINSFFFCRWLSNHPAGLFVSNIINSFPEIPIKQQYMFARNYLPNTIKYIQYPKQDKFDDKEILEILMEHFKCSEKIAERYFQILPDTEVERLREIYTVHGRQK